MEKIRTNYEKWYEDESYYWGTEPAAFISRTKEKAENLKMDQALERYKRGER